MKRVPKYTLMMAHLTETVGLCNFFMLMSSNESQGYDYIELWPWMVCALGIFWGVDWLLRREPTVVTVAMVGAGSFLVTGTVLSLWFVQISSLAGWAMAWLFFGITVLRAWVLQMREFDMLSALVHCELPIFGVAFLLFMYVMGVYTQPTYYLVCTVAVMLGSFVALMLGRLEGDGGSQRSGGALTTMVGCFALLGCGSYLFTRFVSGQAANIAHGVTVFVRNVVTSVLSTVWELLVWLLSLIPTGEGGEIEMEPPQMSMEELEALPEADPQALGWLALLAAVVGACALVYVLYRLRKVRLSRKRVQVVYHRPTQVVEKVSLWARFLAFCRRGIQAMGFALEVYAQRNTPRGCAVLLSGLGRKRGLPKAVGESYSAYLLRLGTRCGREEQRFTILANALAQELYAPASNGCALRPTDYRALRRAVRCYKKSLDNGSENLAKM